MQSRIALSQYSLSAADLEVVLALVRTGTLASAGERLGLNASTVFRSLQRIERGLGAALFMRGRNGYEPNELASLLAEQAEHVEAALEASRAAVRQQPGSVSGTVRITTTDTILHGLVAPSLARLREAHHLLEFELHTGNELASLTRRDADIAVRATKHPPTHLVGRRLGPIRVALFAAASSGLHTPDDLERAAPAWVAPDDALPEHPSVLWRRKAFPRVQPAYRVSSILTVAHLVQLGLGVGVLPLFLAREMSGLLQLGEALDDAQTDLWLLTHPQARHLRRVAAVYAHLGASLHLD
ncbi:LysR family transcriptional regulator [Lysobacter niastensis]|uniref:LysR family transcriptional regulator n=1 Tax=Lysobacter niastensis TaxID=380629 RepID=A0ABS0B7B8_9GAMM|nr:LysR family transcriptional regulator [Lysobacter niastensis]MBF6024890.1 LysR family transcriptional regulator [Lysobacter niastensis]